MRNTKKVQIAILAILLFISESRDSSLIAQEQAISTQVLAVLKELAGTVEIKKANSDIWETASQGQTLAWDTVISTGFRSTAVVTLGNSLITLRPLSRISIVELSQAQGIEKTELFLQTGKVRADVNLLEGSQTEFVIRSPNATNSVRGTTFEFDTILLTVYEGTVEFKSLSNYIAMIDAGAFSKIDERTGRITSPTIEAIDRLWPSPPIGSQYVNVSAEYPTPSSATPSQPGQKPDPGPSPGPGSNPQTPGPTPGPDPGPTPGPGPGPSTDPITFIPIIKF